jgi:3-deoxy-D-manno-octulosonic-acid transferase
VTAAGAPLPLRLYGAATGLLEPLAPALLAARARRGQEVPARLGERLGRAGQPRPPGRLVWLHGASVGEGLALLPLVERLAARPDLRLLVTSGTVTSADLLARRLPPGVIHQFAPVDGPAAAARFLDHWRPHAGLIAESELWPNLILAARARGVRLALVSARITAHSAAGWARAPASARALLSAFELILPQDPESAERLRRLGAAPGPVLNLKRAGVPLPCDAAALAALQAAIGGRPVVLAASTHPGEEARIAAAVQRAWQAPGGLLIVAPRHPDRGPAVAAGLAAQGFVTARRSAGEPLTGQTTAYVADTLGEMGALYRCADVTVLGGGLAPGVGGHNPLEAARLGAAVISGRQVDNARELYAEMEALAAVRLVSDDEDLARALGQLLADPAARAALGQAARRYAEDQAQALPRAWPLIEALVAS